MNTVTAGGSDGYQDSAAQSDTSLCCLTGDEPCIWWRVADSWSTLGYTYMQRTPESSSAVFTTTAIPTAYNTLSYTHRIIVNTIHHARQHIAIHAGNTRVE
ncbi:hypothetical protein Pcinc_043699 [Petrolisthes cinctipes]|uniref:Uncharacterized protein n=1 Tax=Petrolisthes cinctipes TaxID=88211 RepID=A0AAE1EEZ0_PETCI|nr:hypothetical protein Pcinc_043699 [Petrolisthes cinctipes]